MKRFRGLFCTALAVLAGTAAPAQERKPSPEEEAVMRATMQRISPGEHHQHLEKFAGKWNTTNRMWMDPSAPPVESKGTMDAKMVLGGRYLVQEYQGTVNGMPFEGIGTTAYDNMRKMYVSTWMDNFGTGIMQATGSCSANGNEATFTGAMDDPMQNATGVKFREVMRWTGPDAFTFEMYSTYPGKSETKNMEIVHTRVK